MAGMLVAELVIYLLGLALDDEQMFAWGWRVPFWIALPWGCIIIALRSTADCSSALPLHAATRLRHRSCCCLHLPAFR